jgi:hypothetical protein
MNGTTFRAAKDRKIAHRERILSTVVACVDGVFGQIFAKNGWLAAFGASARGSAGRGHDEK